MNPYKLATWHGRNVIDSEGRPVDAAELLEHANKLRADNAALLAALETAANYLGDDATDDSPEARNTRRIVRAAIAAARGGQS